MSRESACDVAVEFLSTEGSAETFARVVHREMGMSAEEFLSRWDAGEWIGTNPDDVPGLVDVLMVLPLVR